MPVFQTNDRNSNYRLRQAWVRTKEFLRLTVPYPSTATGDGRAEGCGIGRVMTEGGERSGLQNDGRHRKHDRDPRAASTENAVRARFPDGSFGSARCSSDDLEDAHSTNPTSLDCSVSVLDGIPSLHVMLIVTFRPEFVPPSIGRPHVELPLAQSTGAAPH